MSHYKIIANPTSGRGAGQASLPSIENFFIQHRLDYQITTTEYPGHAIELAYIAASEKNNIVISVGGDGTANEVLNGLIKAKAKIGNDCPMGIIAVGRGNDFAFGVGIGMGVETGCEIILRNNIKKIDVGLVKGGNFPEGRYFGNGLGIGFDAVVGFEALKITWLSGFPSYIVAVFITMFLYFNAPTINIRYDDNELEIAAIMASIMNGRRMGGGFLMAPNSVNNDGMFDICLAEQMSRLRILQLIPHFLKGTQSSQKEIRFYKAKELKIKALKGSLPVHADGETVCTAGNELEIKLIPNHIQMICPSSE